MAAKDEWLPEYTRRAGEVMDLLAAGGRTVIWVGIPNDDNPDVTARLAVQDEAVRAALAARPDVEFVDTWARFSSPNGGWAEYVIDPATASARTSAPTTASTSTRTAPRSSPSTSPRSSRPTSAPAAPQL